jgi:SulP family sulfate permease
MSVTHHALVSMEFWRRCSLDALYGLINAILVIPVNISFASIIFRDPFFQPYLPSLVNLVLFSSAVHQVVFSLRSTLPFAIGQVQDAGLIFLAAIVGSISITLQSEGYADEKILSTCLVALSVSTGLLGVALIVLGRFRLASAVQYLPMPVVGGYLAFIG